MATAEDVYLAKEIEMLSDDLLIDMQKYLDEISTTGNFATRKKLAQSVDPQVRLLGTDDIPGHDISIPLSSRDAFKLIQAAQLASSVEGEQVVTDTSNGKWEIGPDRFSLSEHWQSYVNTILTVVCNDLGVIGDGISAELHKMLLYETGVLVNYQDDREFVSVAENNDKPLIPKDTNAEKSHGVFAKLVISLPSAHWGGDVIVSRNGLRYSLQTQGHEYLACLRDNDPEYLNSAASGERRLRAILTEWNTTIQQGAPEAEKMVYPLEHKYTNASISLDTLEGMDLLRAQRLLSVCDQLGYTLYLADMEKQVHGSAEISDRHYNSHYYDSDQDSGDELHDIQEIFEETLKLTRVVDTDGNVLVTGIDIEEMEILRSDTYEDRDPDAHEYSRSDEYSTHWYRDSVLILVPNEYILEGLLGQSTGKNAEVLAILRHLAKRLRNIPESAGESLKESLRQTCLKISDNPVRTTYAGVTGPRYLDSTVSEAITICTEFGMTDVLLSLSSAFKESLSADALECLGNLKQNMNLDLPEERRILETIFGRVVLGHKTVSKKYDTLSTLIDAEALDVQNQEDCMPELKSWVMGTLATVFSNLDSLTTEDGDVIARIATSDTSGSLLKDRIIPSIERQMQGKSPEKTSFMVASLCKISELSNPLPGNLLSIYQPLIRMVLANISLRKPQASQPQSSLTYGAYGGARVQPATCKPALHGQLLSSLLGYINDSEAFENGALLVVTVIAQAFDMGPLDYEYTILPFLKGIIMRLLQGKNELDMYHNLFQTCLSIYIQRCVGKKPVQINWSRNPVRCNCRDCTGLNAFLRSPVDRVKRIVVSKQRRHHLHIQLDAHTDCTHLTERGYTETMVVTKQGKSFGDSLRAWKTKAKSVLAVLRSLEDQEDASNSLSQLKKLLGHKYDEIMTLREVRVMTAARQQPTRPPQTVVTPSSSSNAATIGAPYPTATQPETPQIAGRKRKAVVIDLSDD
ncbi:hypothetical protein E4T44_03007 [Aureobasidium sp. EXF-8845]|nr:hypothetical protein E4T44_03007 [Aureobasidium sp. EXF-8845]KAI4855602.1 hypothetical protein E4T45_02953 [Aureobasidium sp. EXF-8846]